MPKNIHFVRWIAVLAMILSIALAAQTHPMSEITPVDTGLDMGGYDVLIGSGGKLGVGTSTPSVALHVVGGICLESSESSCIVFGGNLTAESVKRKGVSDYMVLNTSTPFGGVVSGTYNSLTLNADTVEATHILANAVNALHVQAGAVGSSEIAADAVGADEIVADAVGSSEIAADSVTNSELDNTAAFDMGSLTVDGNTLYVVSDKIGIGNSSPGNFELSVAGDFGVGGTIYEGGTSLSGIYQEEITGSCTGDDFVSNIADGGATSCNDEPYDAAADLIGTISEWDSQCSSCAYAGDVAADLDFADFQSSLDLDVSTSINLGAYSFYFDLDSTGDLYIRDYTTQTALFYDNGDIELGNNDELYIDTSVGRVGIGTNSPADKLTVDGHMEISDSSGEIMTGSSSGQLQLFSGSGQTDGGYIYISGESHADQGQIEYVVNSYTSLDPEFQFRKMVGSTTYAVARITKEGNFGIAMDPGTTYKFAVNGDMYAHRGIVYGGGAGGSCQAKEHKAFKFIKYCSGGQLYLRYYFCAKTGSSSYSWVLFATGNDGYGLDDYYC